MFKVQNHEDEENTLYQQSAQSHRPQAVYFQLLDPCTRGHQELKTQQLLFHK